MDSKIENINIEERKVNEILGKTPSWFLNWGVYIIFFLIVLFFSMATYIKYPESIILPIKINSKSLPVTISSKWNDVIDTLMVVDKENISQGDFIIVVGRKGQYKNIYAIKTIINSDINIKNICKKLTNKSFDLVNFSNNYTLLIEAQANLDLLIKEEDFFNQEINSFIKEIELLKKLNLKLDIQSRLFKEELGFIEAENERNTILYSQGVISKQEKEKFDVALLKSKREFHKLEISHFRNEISIEQIKAKLIDYKKIRIKKVNDLEVKIKFFFNLLKYDIQIWENNHIIKSPIDGVLSFHRNYSEGEVVKQGEELFTISPKCVSNVLGRGKLPINTSGKVSIGNIVFIEFDAFPRGEYGYIEGRVSELSLIPVESKGKFSYNVSIAIDYPLITKHGLKINFNQNITGKAMIITENKSIFDRIFYQILKVIKK